MKRPRIPKDFPVRPLSPRTPAHGGTRAECGVCGWGWDDSKATSYTPAPAGRCPFESFHEHEDDDAHAEEHSRKDYERALMVAGERGRALARERAKVRKMHAALVKASDYMDSEEGAQAREVRRVIEDALVLS